jgi:hypothetical protein
MVKYRIFNNIFSKFVVNGACVIAAGVNVVVQSVIVEHVVAGLTKTEVHHHSINISAEGLTNDVESVAVVATDAMTNHISMSTESETAARRTAAEAVLASLHRHMMTPRDDRKVPTQSKIHRRD